MASPSALLVAVVSNTFLAFDLYDQPCQVIYGHDKKPATFEGRARVSCDLPHLLVDCQDGERSTWLPGNWVRSMH